MKIRELIQLLQELPDDLDVVMSKDAEGNNFSPFTGLCPGKYIADNTWSGEFTAELDEENAVCLWPTN